MVEEESSLAEEQEPSLSDTINNAFDNAESTEVDEATEESNDVVEGLETSETESESVDEPGQVLAPIAPPLSWSKDAKEQFSKFPREAQQAVSQREVQRERFLQEKSREASDVKRQYADIDDALKPIDETLALRGMSRGAAIKQLATAQAMMDKDPVGTLKQMAASYGLNLSQLAQQEPRVDPHYARLESELQALKQDKIAEQQRTQQQTQAVSQQEIQAFMNAADADGNLQYPYFDSVRQDMAAIVDSLERQNPNVAPQTLLQDAYERAVRANPETYEAMRQSEIAHQEASRLVEAQKKATQAAKAGSSISGAPESNGAPDTSGDIRSTLMQAFG